MVLISQLLKRKKISRNLRQLDALAQLTIDRILPSNLTIRYIMALGSVAILAVAGQLLIQISLARQYIYQEKVRILYEQIHISENLRKTTFALQLSTDANETQNQVETISQFVSGLEEGKKRLNIKEPVWLKAEDNFNKIVQLSSTLPHLLAETLHSRAKLARARYEINHTAEQLLVCESTYLEELKTISDYFNKILERQLNRFKKTEFFLMILTLLVLALEGLYVFRPGIERLYEALRIRSDFLSRMSHEMRNPMNSIIGMANLLGETPLTDQQKKYVSMLRKSSTGLLDMLNKLLDFSSIESAKIKLETIPFNLMEVLERSIDQAVFGAHANGIELILELGSKVPLVLKGDPIRLQQILSNLLGNAVKFTKQGDVTLKVEPLKNNGTCVIQFSVIDTGIGIDKDKAKRIFDPFVQEDSSVKRRFGGTGLGLSISKELVELMGGRLTVESEKNVGSRFFFSIPFQLHSSAKEASTLDSIVQREKLGQFRALVLESNPKIGQSTQTLLEAINGQPRIVLEAGKMVSFFANLEEELNQFDVILIDYGFVFAELANLMRRIKNNQALIKALYQKSIFLLKTTASSSDIEKLGELGAKHFLFKPINPTQVIESIALVLSSVQGPSRVPYEKLVETKTIPRATTLNLQDDRPLRILAADDSKDNQFLIKAYLQPTPYRITFADNGSIAVDKFKEGHFDIVLMDIQMPEMDGYSASDLIRQWESTNRLEPTPIIAISAHNIEKESTHPIQYLFSQCLLKPINPEELRRAILELAPNPNPENSKRAVTPAQQKDAAAEYRDHIAQVEQQLRELAPKYLKNRSEEVIELKKLVKDLDFKKIRTIGHRLKGNAKSYGFPGLGEIGSDLEVAAENGDIGSIQELIKKTEQFITEAIAPLSK